MTWLGERGGGLEPVRGDGTEMKAKCNEGGEKKEGGNGEDTAGRSELRGGCINSSMTVNSVELELIDLS